MTRIYLVETSGVDGVSVLVNANSRQSAINYVARQTVRASVASQHTIVDMLMTGNKVHNATAAQQELTIPE